MQIEIKIEETCKEPKIIIVTDKQSGIYFAVVCAVSFPIAYAANWMKHSVAGVLSYVGLFIAIFVCVWLVQYFLWKSKIKKMNDGVKNKSC